MVNLPSLPNPIFDSLLRVKGGRHGLKLNIFYNEKLCSREDTTAFNSGLTCRR